MNKSSCVIPPSVLCPTLASVREALNAKGVSPKETLIALIKLYDGDYFRFSIDVDNYFFEMASEIDMLGVSVDSGGFIENVIHPSAREVHLNLSKYFDADFSITTVLWMNDNAIQIFAEKNL